MEVGRSCDETVGALSKGTFANSAGLAGMVLYHSAHPAGDTEPVMVRGSTELPISEAL